MIKRNKFSRRDFVATSAKGAIGVTALALMPEVIYAGTGENTPVLTENKKGLPAWPFRTDDWIVRP